MIKILVAITLFYFSACQKINTLQNKISRDAITKELVWDMDMNEQGYSNTKAVVHTIKGSFTMKFYSLLAPKSSEKVINLIQKGYFDGGNVSRSFKNYILQFGGTNKRASNEGAFANLFEFNSIQHILGSVGLVIKDGKNWENEKPEIYISMTTLPHLDHKFTVFAQVTEGLDVVEKLKLNDQILKIELKN